MRKLVKLDIVPESANIVVRYLFLRHCVYNARAVRIICIMLYYDLSLTLGQVCANFRV